MNFDPQSKSEDLLPWTQVEECAQIIRQFSLDGDLATPELNAAFQAACSYVRFKPVADSEALLSLLDSKTITSHPIASILSWFVRANFAIRLGNNGSAVDYAAIARSQSLLLADESLISRSCILAAMGAYRLGEYPLAQAYYEEALVSSRRLGDRRREGTALLGLGLVAKNQGDIRLAERLTGAAIPLLRQFDDAPTLARGLLNLGIIQAKRGAWEQATSAIKEAKQLCETHRMVDFHYSALLALARVARLTGDAKAAHDYVTLVVDSTPSIPSKRTIAIAHEYLGDLLLDQGDDTLALATYEHALALARLVSPQGDLMVECLRRMGEALLSEPTRYAEGIAFAQEAITLARSQRDHYELAASLQTLGRLHGKSSDNASARAALEEALRLSLEMGDPFEHGRSALFLSEVAHAAGDHLDAVGLAIEAKRVLAIAPQNRWAIEADNWLTQLTAGLAAHLNKMEQQNRQHQPEAHSLIPDGAFLTLDSTVKRGLGTLRKLAPRALSIIVLGESGTGKELIAKAIHDWSERKGPFVPVNCSAIPSELIEGELFGHARGAFTGADKERGGLIEFSNKGTLFLDEIGDMPVRAQARLLRALESGEIRRLGENAPRIVDVRVVAATHRDLLEMVSAGEFRLDLYYRLAGYVLRIPPVRERDGDAALLVNHFFAEFCQAQDKQLSLSADLKQQLASHSWPGNAREIKHVMHRLVSLAEHGHVVKELPFDLEGAPRPRSLPQVLEAEERKRIVDALRTHNWNKARASASLGMSRTTLIGKMKRLGVVPPQA